MENELLNHEKHTEGNINVSVDSIINHDVLIGEQGSTSQYYQYLFHDECNTGTTNVAGTCVTTNWNDTSSNTLLENGGSLYGVGSGNGVDCSDPLNDASCSGYA